MLMPFGEGGITLLFSYENENTGSILSLCQP
jgi:hypothetical protein